MSNHNRTNSNDEFPAERQLRLTGQIRQNREDGECIHFTIHLGLFSLKCIVNIPDNESDEAPVYVKFRLRKQQDKQHEVMPA